MNSGRRRLIFIFGLMIICALVYMWLYRNSYTRTNESWNPAIFEVILVDVECLNKLGEGKVCSNPAVISTFQQDGLQSVDLTKNAATDYVIVHYPDGDRAFRSFNTTFATLSYQIKDIVHSIMVLVPRNIQDFIRQHQVGRFLKCGGVNVTGRLPEYAKRIIPLSYLDYLTEFRDLMWSYNTTAFLFCGTLLGWRRECSIIPHTEDVDFAALIEEFPKEFYENLKQSSFKNFRPAYLLGNPKNSLEIKMWVDSRPMDLFFVYPNASNNTSNTYGLRWWLREPIKYTYPRIKDICAGDLAGKLMYVPCNADKLLEAEYGPDWVADKPTHNNAFKWDRTANMEVLPKYNETEWPDYFRQF